MIIHLCFHGIGTCQTEREPGEARYWISEQVFLETLDLVRELDFVELSFDDGNRSDIETGLPALLERGLDATFFALAGRLHDRASLTADDLVQLRAHGMRVGSHGWQHVPWKRLGADRTQQEFVDARRRLEDASGASIDAAALPLGRYDRRALQGLRRAGFQRVYSSDRYPARASSWLQPRFSLLADDTPESVSAMLHSARSPRSYRNAAASLVKRFI